MRLTVRVPYSTGRKTPPPLIGTIAFFRNTPGQTPPPRCFRSGPASFRISVPQPFLRQPACAASPTSPFPKMALPPPFANPPVSEILIVIISTRWNACAFSAVYRSLLYPPLLLRPFRAKGTRSITFKHIHSLWNF